MAYMRPSHTFARNASVFRLAALAAFWTGRVAAAQASREALAIQASSTVACADQDVTLTAKRGAKSVAATWSSDAPAVVGAFGPATGETAVLKYRRTNDSTATTGSVLITATSDSEKVSTRIRLAGLCDGPFGGELTRATLGYEQIGASGVESAQKYAFDFYISRPIPNMLARQGPQRHYFGWPVRWWGDVRVASYPQQISTEAAAFASGFVTNVGKVTVSRLVQTAEFTTGLELRLTGSTEPIHGVAEATRQRFALMGFAGFGAVGPFPLSTDPPAVFAVPSDSSPSQKRAFQADFPGVTSKYVAFRVGAPDRFLGNLTGGFRLYTFYADRGASGEPLQSAPAMVAIAYGWNQLISPRGGAFHVSAYYPFAFGDREDPKTIVIYLFGDVWMTGQKARFTAPEYQLAAATDSGKAVVASDPRVTIVAVRDKPRDTYRVGLSLDLLKVWERLNSTPAAR